MSDVPKCFENVESQKDVLKVLANCKRVLRQAIIKGGDKKLISVICECCFNFLEGRLNINKEELEKLKKYKTTLRKLVNKSSLKTKKKILLQQGGFLPILLPAVIGGLATIISSAINKI